MKVFKLLIFFPDSQKYDDEILKTDKYGKRRIYKSLLEISLLFNNKFQVKTTIVDTSDLDAVRAAVRSKTKLIHIETPGNPTLTVSDIAEIAKIDHENGALLSVDNTFASP